MITELGGPFAFGLSAFTLIFAATQILAISRLVSAEHAPLWSAIEFFFWQLPQIVITVVPMAMLLGVLLALQRMSGESEITAMKAGGIGLVRAVTPLLLIGLLVSFVALIAQEGVVPFANDRATYLREEVIKHSGGIGPGNLTVTTDLPGGGRQLVAATAYEASTQTLRHVTIIQYDRLGRPVLIIFTDRLFYQANSWKFTNADEYEFRPDGTTYYSQLPTQQVEIGQKPSQIMQRATNNNPEEMSRSQIREILSSGQLSQTEIRTYQTSYEEKLARPFASFVFTLIAVPFGLRPARGGGSTGLGFGLAVAIVFVYFVIASVFSAVFTGLPGGFALSTFGAWAPNLIFTAIGAVLLNRAASS